MKLFEIFAELGLDASKFESGVKKASKQGGTLASDLKSGLGGAASFVQNKVSATTVMLGNLMADVARRGIQLVGDVSTAGIKYNATMETYVTNFRTMLGGSSEAAQQLTTDLEDMAAATPFAMSDLADATQTLLNFGQDSSTVLDTLQSLGDIAMGDANKLQSLTLAFGQASSSGKLMGQDLMQMINAGFNPLQTIAEKTGASMGDLKDFMSDGKASAELKKQMKAAKREVKALGDQASDGAKMLVQMSQEGAISADLLGQVFAIETSPGGRFYNAMKNASETFDGMVSTLEDDATALMGKFLKPVSNWMTADLLPKALKLIDVMDNAFDEGGITAALDAGTAYISEVVGEWGSLALDAGSSFLANMLSGITGDTVSADGIKTTVTGLWTEGQTAVDNLKNAGSGLFKGILDGLAADGDSKTGITEELSGLWDEADSALESFTSGAGNLLGTIYEKITGLEPTAENVGNTIGGIIGAHFNGIVDLLDNADTLMDDIDDALGSNAAPKDKLVEIWTATGDAMGRLIYDSSDFMINLYEAITGDTGTKEKLDQYLADLFDVELGNDYEEAQAYTPTKEHGYIGPDEQPLVIDPTTGNIVNLGKGKTVAYHNGHASGTWQPTNVGVESRWSPGQRWLPAEHAGGEDTSSLADAVAQLTAVAATLGGEAAYAAISGINGAKVEMDGSEVGQLVLPYVSAGLGRANRLMTKARSAEP